MKITKKKGECVLTNNVLTKAFTPTEEDLEKIKSFTQRDFAPEELFIFKMVLCTNEADRDFDVFSPAALRDMQKLFIGKPGLRDHIAGTDYQTARIFDTYIEPAEGKGYGGEELLCLKAKAYIPRCPETEGIINAVEAGIKREVSVSCAIGKSHCSICGESEGCSHIPGKKYDGKLCARIIDSVSDAYEWSFVAVPAQRYAGVTKSFEGGDDYKTNANSINSENCETIENRERTETGETNETSETNETTERAERCAKGKTGAKGTKGTEHTNIEEQEQETPDATALQKRLNTGSEVTLSAPEACTVAKAMAENEELQKLALAYKNALREYALRLAKSVPGADMKSFDTLLQSLSATQLQQFNTALKGCAELVKADKHYENHENTGTMPTPQLSPVRESTNTQTLNEFKI